MGPRLVLAALAALALAGCGSGTSNQDAATMDAAPGAAAATNLPPPAPKNLPQARGMVGAAPQAGAAPMAKPSGM